jgi:hypothetical protein
MEKNKILTVYSDYITIISVRHLSFSVISNIQCIYKKNSSIQSLCTYEGTFFFRRFFRVRKVKISNFRKQCSRVMMSFRTLTTAKFTFIG